MPNLDALAQYAQYLEPDAYQSLLAALEKPLATSIRLNTLKIQDTAAKIQDYATRYGWQVQPVPFCESGWQLADYDQRPGQTLAHTMGMYYVQDAASMLPAEMFSAADAPMVLDLAAAPGGKTTHLVSRFADNGYIVANDSSKKRITALRSNLQVWGAFGVMTSQYQGENFGQWLPDTFDKILLDAPCSGDTLREEKGRKKRQVSISERDALAARQLSLLTSAFHAAKVGGEIVYSTCTLNPQENEGVLSALLNKFPAEIEMVEGLPQTGIQDEARFHPQVQHATRLWPHLFETSGFFAAKIRKLDHVEIEVDDPPFSSSVTWNVIKPKLAKPIFAQLMDDYGFDFATVVEAKHLVLLEKDQSIYAVPETLYHLSGELPVMSLGLLIGQSKGQDFIPSHELVSRYWDAFKGQRLPLTAADDQSIWLSGRDLRGDVPHEIAQGKIALMVDAYGEFIGRGKVLASRIRNLLPKRAI